MFQKFQFRGSAQQKTRPERAIYPLRVRSKRVAPISAISSDTSARFDCPPGFKAIRSSGSVRLESGRVENMREVVIRARFMLCLSTVRRACLSHPNFVFVPVRRAAVHVFFRVVDTVMENAWTVDKNR